jgi:hypothetical protein
MKEQSGVPSNKLNDCPSLGERFTGGGGGGAHGRDEVHKGLSKSCGSDFITQFCAGKET